MKKALICRCPHCERSRDLDAIKQRGDVEEMRRALSTVPLEALLAEVERRGPKITVTLDPSKTYKIGDSVVTGISQWPTQEPCA